MSPRPPRSRSSRSSWRLRQSRQSSTSARAERPPPGGSSSSLGLLLIAGALNSPLETIAANYLLLFHLLQNVMIADWAPPLLILGLTSMRASVARAGGKPFAVLTRPRIALPVWLVGWYAIHLALFYDFALEHAWTLNIEHLLLIAMGFIFWWPVLADEPADIGAPVKIGYLGAAFVGATFLGLGLTFASTPFYDFYADAPRLWGSRRARPELRRDPHERRAGARLPRRDPLLRRQAHPGDEERNERGRLVGLAVGEIQRLCTTAVHAFST